jgi:hypothetical protein
VKSQGKYGLEWAKVSKELKAEFDQLGIRYCEAKFRNCTSHPQGFAHTLKRRHLGQWGSEERANNIREVVLLCNNCHDVLELMGEAVMYAELTRLIQIRVGAGDFWSDL